MNIFSLHTLYVIFTEKKKILVDEDIPDYSVS